MNKSISQSMDEALALNKELGFHTTVFEPGKSSVRVVSTPLHENHVGSIHAGVLFTLAEYTSGSVLLGCILDSMDRIFSVVKTGNIDFVTSGKGSVVARGELESQDILNARDRVINGEKVDIPVEIVIENEQDGSLVAKASFLWALRKIK